MIKLFFIFLFITLAFAKTIILLPKSNCKSSILKDIVKLVNNIISVRNEISKNLTLTYLLGYYPHIENVTIKNINCTFNSEYEATLNIKLYEKYKVTSPDIKISKRIHRLFYRISAQKFFDALADAIFQNYGQYITNLNITLYVFDGKNNTYIPACYLYATYDDYLSGSYKIICTDQVFLFCKKEYQELENKALNGKEKEDKDV